MRKLVLTSFMAAGLLSAGTVEAQSGLPLAFDVRGGVAFPTGEWSDEDDIETGVGFGITAHFNFSPALGAYAGYERFSFGVDGVDGADATDAGARFGLQAGVPVTGLPLAPYVFGGATYQKTALSASEGGVSIDFESDYTLGFEVGLGARIGLGNVVSITPAVRYSSHNAEFDALSGLVDDEDLTVGRIVLDVGLLFGL